MFSKKDVLQKISYKQVVTVYKNSFITLPFSFSKNSGEQCFLTQLFWRNDDY